jgi:hypothetical protein
MRQFQIQTGPYTGELTFSFKTKWINTFGELTQGEAYYLQIRGMRFNTLAPNETFAVSSFVSASGITK